MYNIRSIISKLEKQLNVFGVRCFELIKGIYNQNFDEKEFVDRARDRI